ncbi:hypothetical protein SERLA73DRAFT_143123 [Serpula lacrymans var. lacrymans S7.3]|uniref:Uncharacterized protein n=2 Tax=Serpula lacrymans var. lacrymans TaxID=341189 RepID=F8Q925_SERL3|nr:uncharacterized protein SERLADRAFT_399531 [Serpula lacrymans var. lacrymans S7.9]EGN95080.1 hypothetical protein SERLA73DRAFT_143123 [Serpula lacrymans var. lacrymans S7.3]EGO20568.1 hypothetical protein SERLADRAFT_399531 [Serpula lacrymans var. lacrymans S7.9]
MPKNSQYHPPQIPLRQSVPSLEKFSRRVFLTGLVFCPGLIPVSARLIVFHMLILLPALVGEKSREYKHRLNSQFFKGAKIRFDALC